MLIWHVIADVGITIGKCCLLLVPVVAVVEAGIHS